MIYVTGDTHGDFDRIAHFCARMNIDRKNFLFANTPGGAQGSAVIFSLIQTAIANGLDPWRYLTWLIDMAASWLVPAYICEREIVLLNCYLGSTNSPHGRMATIRRS